MTPLERFETGRIEPAAFTHADHVRVAHAMVVRDGFALALPGLCAGLLAMATRAGRPEKFNATITTAFLALIAERAAAAKDHDYDAFAAMNPDLFDRNVLSAWYSADQLQSPVARRTFVLPRRPDTA